MALPILYGTEFSTYVRTARMALAEKPAQYTHVDVSVIRGENREPAHVGRNPFGTVPAFEHDGFKCYETGAIIRYIDQVCPGRKLTPEDPRARARMNQIISIIDYHGYSSMIGAIVVQRLFSSLVGGTTDEAVVKAAAPKAELVLKEIDRILGSNPFLAGAELSLADLYVVPILFYFAMTPEKSALAPCANLNRWRQAINERESAKSTAPKLG
jgi:glutathione S-transferase